MRKNRDIIGLKPLVCVRVGPDTWAEPAALRLGRPGALPVGLVQPFNLKVKQGDNALGSIHRSVCPSAHPSVCLYTLSFLNFDLEFWHKGRP